MFVDNVWLLVSAGMSEQEVMELPLDKFNLYTQAELKRQKLRRKVEVVDMAGAISGVFGKDGIKGYLKSLDGDR